MVRECRPAQAALEIGQCQTRMNLERTIEVDGACVPYKLQPLWMSVASFAGLPATAMPAGRDRTGLPIGVQAIGPYLEDRTTIAFAQLFGREFGGYVAPPGFAA